MSSIASLKFDVHHHFVPEFYAEALRENGGDPSGWTIPTWTVQASQQIMDQHRIGATILSMTAPGPSLFKEGDRAIALARKTNQCAANIRDKNPEKFGFFAALPSLLDEEAALSEVRYALDELHADGVTLFTRYGEGNHYLGHQDFQNIWKELDERSAVVFVHPTHGVDTNLVSAALPQPMVDYPHETTRTAMDLILSGTVRKHPNCKIILSHAGGTLPYLALRVAAMTPHTPFGAATGLTANQVLEDAKSFYFDLALSSHEYSLDLLRRFANPGHILFGSDFPYAPSEGIKFFVESFDNSTMSDEERLAISSGNAIKLFKRFNQYQK
ncbi:hypothetical protein ABW19_dt0203303 [Dactylella cylindrospora]|nr:hypothetical protein ABW19_dt0203303 [Dactylella cylindrospora]